MMHFFEELVLKDFWLKLFSFALAVLAWFTVDVALRNASSSFPLQPLSLAASQTRAFDHLPVTVMSSAEDVRSVRVQPQEVEVTVQGEAKVLDKLQSKDIRVIVDLTGIQTTNASLRRRIEVSTPAGVTHVKVDPEQVQVLYPAKG